MLFHNFYFDESKDLEFFYEGLSSKTLYIGLIIKE